MDFLGKEYKFDRQENFDGFLKSAGLTEDQIARFMEYKPSVKLVKNGDSYTIISVSAQGVKETKFTPGVEFDDYYQESKIPVKTLFTIEGNTITQVVKASLGSATFKREYNGDELCMTITGSKFDGVAKRYFKA